MKHPLSSPFLLLFFLLLAVRAFSQGCSDGGVCSVGSLSLVQFKFNYLPHEENKLTALAVEDPSLALRNGQKDSLPPSTKPDITTADSSALKKSGSPKYFYLYPKYFFQYTTSYGLSDGNTSIITTQLEGNIRLVDQKLFAQVKLPYAFVNGKLGSTNALGDVTLSLSYIAFNHQKSSLSLSGGVKIPSNKADLSLNGLPLPMVYQTSLGSTDILLGAKYTLKKWDVTIGYQHSFNANSNGYLHNPLAGDTLSYNSYFESKNLRRSDDGVFRINRTFTGKKINVSTGVLLIYHMANDVYTNAFGERIQSKGSQGLTVNLNLAGVIPLSKKFDFIFICAKPLHIRDARPDGLTRKVVALLGLKYSIF